MKRFYQLLSVIEVMGAFVPLIVFAQSTQNVNPAQSVTGINSILSIVCSLVNLLFIILVIVAIIFVIIAAFRYLTAGGEAEKISEANKSLIFAAVALAVGILAKALPLIVGSLISSSANSSSGLSVCGASGAPTYTPGS